MYDDYEGPINYALALKGAIAIVLIFVLVVVVANYWDEYFRRGKNKK
jgi:hypothetical protein